jgi:dolichol kinase
MGVVANFRYRRISQNATVNDLLKETVRKGIHFCAGFVPAFASWNFSWTVFFLVFVISIYVVCEYRRLGGNAVPVVSRVTSYASRRRDDGRFVLGPVTMGLGVLLSLLLFPQDAARYGVFALAFGDGIASLAGKLFGRNPIPGARGKTFEGSTACFIAVFLASFIMSGRLIESIAVALLAMAIEILPLKDYDNLVIPIAIAAFVQMIR